MGQRISLSKPFFDEREIEAVRRVLASGWVVQGPEVEAFEAELARLQSAKHAIALSSGTAALHVAYLALGLGPGDRVFIPSFAWPSAANMAKVVGAEPAFVDVLPESYNLDPEDLTRRIEASLRDGGPKPKAIVPVHEFGLAADLDQILAVAAQYSLAVIEDAACALGAHYKSRPVGTFGSLGIFSFHPRKSITTGEGGAIVTNSDELALRCRQWRNHGQKISSGRREFVVPGLNYRLTEMQAAIGMVQLSKLEGILAQRQELVGEYTRSLASLPALRMPAAPLEHTWQTFMPVLGEEIDRSTLIREAAAVGIEVGPGSVAGHLGQHFQPQAALIVSERLHHSGLALPLHPQLSVAETRTVVQFLQKALN